MLNPADDRTIIWRLAQFAGLHVSSDAGKVIGPEAAGLERSHKLPARKFKKTSCKSDIPGTVKS
jgi:hypothetical protein